MTKQAENFINLCKGNSIETVKKAVKMLLPKTRNELKEHFKAEDDDTLAAKIAIA